MKKVYYNLQKMTCLEVETISRILKKRMPDIFEECRQINKRKDVDSTLLYILLIEHATKTIPLIQSCLKTQIALENHIISMYSSMELTGMRDQFACVRRLFNTTTETDSASIWRICLAHMLSIGIDYDKGPKSSARMKADSDPGFAKDCVFVCAAYVGDPLTQFLYLILSIDTLFRFLPHWTRLIMVTYVEVLDNEFNGRVPLNFFIEV